MSLLLLRSVCCDFVALITSWFIVVYHFIVYKQRSDTLLTFINYVNCLLLLRSVCGLLRLRRVYWGLWFITSLFIF